VGSKWTYFFENGLMINVLLYDSTMLALMEISNDNDLCQGHNLFVADIKKMAICPRGATYKEITPGSTEHRCDHFYKSILEFTTL
jgi:hypothetical protein